MRNVKEILIPIPIRLRSLILSFSLSFLSFFKESSIRDKNKVSYFFSETSEPPWTLDQVIWTFCFSLILVVSILGNTIVLWIILGMGRLQFSRFNFFCQLTVQCGVWQTTSWWTWPWRISWCPSSIASPPSSSWETGQIRGHLNKMKKYFNQSSKVDSY